MVVDLSDRARLVAKRLVRLGREVKVEPAELLVVGSDDEVVTHRVDVDRREPAESRLERFDQCLGDEVVKLDVALGLWRRGARETVRIGRTGNSRGEATHTTTKK